MKRRTPLRQTSSLRRLRIKAKKRTSAEFGRIYGSEDRVREVKRLPCSVQGCKRTPSENAHVISGGMGRKADWQYIAPLCHTHHEERDHRLGSNAAFQAKYGVDLMAVALDLSERLNAEGEWV